MWKYYLLSCAGVFRARGNQLWQIVLSKWCTRGIYFGSLNDFGPGFVNHATITMLIVELFIRLKSNESYSVNNDRNVE